MSHVTQVATEPNPGRRQRLRNWLGRYWHMLLIAFGGILVGLIGFGTYITAIEYTNHTEFCITCHVMRATVYPEFAKSSHNINKFGFHAGCPDCHVPQYSWIGELQAKVGTLNELYAYFFLGMNNVANFDKIRPQLAKDVWAKFEANNARECRHCHDYKNMILTEQTPSARVMHTDAAAKNENCIHCHKGIVHKNFEQKAAAPPPTDFDVQ